MSGQCLSLNCSGEFTSMLSKLTELFRLKGRLRRPLCGKPAAFRANARILTFSMGAKAGPSRPARTGWFCFVAPGRAEPFRIPQGGTAKPHFASQTENSIWTELSLPRHVAA
jgi:hypothetical protein